MSGCRGNVEAPPVWWGYCCRVGLSPVALRGLRGRWFCILSKSRIDAQHGGRFRLLSGGAGGWIAPGRSALGGWAACSVYYDLGGKFAPMAAPLLSPSPPPLLWTLSRDHSGRWGWVGLDARSPAGRGWSAGRGWRLVVWLGGAGAALAAACLLRSCSVVPALPLACLSACTGAGCSALPSGLAPAGLRRGAAVSGGQAGRWAGMIPLGWWAGGRRFQFVILHNFAPYISSLFTPLCQVSNS